MNPCMLPYLRSLTSKVSSLVNEEQCRQFGRHVIESARTDMENDQTLASTFLECVTQAGLESTSPILFPKIFNELSTKVFHARVNEYMTASVELDLEKSGKAVKAD